MTSLIGDEGGGAPCPSLDPGLDVKFGITGDNNWFPPLLTAQLLGFV